MSDKLFPDEDDGGKEYEYEDDEGSLMDKITEVLPDTLFHREKSDGKKKEENSTPSGLGLGTDKDEEEEETWKDKVDRFTVVVVSVEVVLLLYFILALLGFVPFF